MNIFKQAEKQITRHTVEKYFHAPGAKWRKNEYWTLSPLRDDKNIKSGTFSISEKGLWKDLATGEAGNFIQLVSKKFNISLRDAAEKIINESGGQVDDTAEKSEKKEKPKPPAIIPIPPKTENLLVKTVQSKYWQDTEGDIKKIYNYRLPNGDKMFAVCRFEKIIPEGKTKKSHIPFYYSAQGWMAGRPPLEKKKGKYPLYGVDRLKNPGPVLIVEGEKCASVKVGGYVLLSWLGGTGSIDKSDWSILEGRKVIIWPDADEPGIKAAVKIKKLVPGSEILDIGSRPQAWDIADAEAEGMNIVEFIKSCPRMFDEKTPATPYEAFKISIEEIYGRENIDQFDGLYYLYDNEEHYWKERMPVNIESDIQKWVEDNHIEYLDMADMAVHTFISNTVSFLRRYSTNYYKINPFKDAALSPYLHFKNGVVHLQDSGYEFISRRQKPECFFKKLYPTHCLQFDYSPELTKRRDIENMAPAFYYYMDSLIPDDMEGGIREAELDKTIDFYSQVIAYSLNPKKHRPKFFAMYGNQDSGKSFFIEILQELIGDGFFVMRRTKEMEGRFSASSLWGSKVFVDDDVKSDLTLPDDFIKLYSGNKSVTIERKNKKEIKGVKISVAMFFISNHVFTLSGGNEGVSRRVIYMPYNKTIKNVDVKLLAKICGTEPKGPESGKFEGQTFDERPAIVSLALRGFEKMVKNNYEFTMPMWVNIEREEWIRSSDTVQQFLEEKLFVESDAWEFKKTEILERYREWCADEGKKPFGKQKFYSKLRQFGGLVHHKSTGDYIQFLKRKKENEFDFI